MTTNTNDEMLEEELDTEEEVSDEEFLQMMREESLKEETEEPVERDEDLPAKDEIDESEEEELEDPKDDPKSSEPEKEIKERSKESQDGQQTTSSEAIDYQGFYEKVMAPIKANGKTLQLRSPEEAIKLIQQGANYTQKMQAIAPHRKILMMLEKNNLLNEDKLSLLIDLDRKDPEAIKKFLQDSKIDAYSIDTSEESKYVPGANKISDDAVAFQEVVDELSTSSTGRDTMMYIRDNWDATSKDIIWKQPNILRDIVQQRTNGVFDKINEEIDRAITLGEVSPNTPYIYLYKAMGDKLFGSATQQQQQPVVNTPIATRTKQPKSVISNGAKVKAAAPTRTTTKQAQVFKNPFEMSDEEFLKTL